MLYPLKFQPIFKERVWGGRKIGQLYHKTLPPGIAIGESWEISDRPGDVSVIANGPLAGTDLHRLMEQRQPELLGRVQFTRFPLLIKILDAQEKLSLQVHPPAELAQRFHGEPKTEMWYLADAAVGAELYAGLKRGMTRAHFESKLKDGTVADCFHRIPVRRGDAMFVPSGRVHAIGSGCVIFEIQQNSDTTFRVFDWNRVGLDGKPRALQVEESLACIDFGDYEPSLIEAASPGAEARRLVQHELFRVTERWLAEGQFYSITPATMEIIGIVEGELTIGFDDELARARSGEFVLFPADRSPVRIQARLPSLFLSICC